PPIIACVSTASSRPDWSKDWMLGVGCSLFDVLPIFGRARHSVRAAGLFAAAAGSRRRAAKAEGLPALPWKPIILQKTFCRRIDFHGPFREWVRVSQPHRAQTER